MRRLAPCLLLVAACSSSSGPDAPAAPCAASLGAEDGFDLVVHGSGGCTGTLRLALRVATGSAAAPTWVDATASPLVVEGAWDAATSGFARPVTVRNTGNAPVTLVGLEWSTRDGGMGFPADRMLHNGYQSWSYTGIEAIPASLADEGGTAPHGGNETDVLDERAGVSWSWGFASDAAHRGVVVGADGATVLSTYIAADGGPAPRLRVVQGMTGDAVTLAPGEARALDGLFLALGDVREGLDAYAAHVAAKHLPKAPRAEALGGWGSWNIYYDQIDAQQLRQEMQWAGGELSPRGLRDLLLDDGYEPHWGAWEAAPDFGADLATLNAEASALGLRPAVWLAPLYVDVTDPIVSLHPDWFVHGEDGAIRTFHNPGGGPEQAPLDVTHPDARAFLVDSIARLRMWGYATLKLDYLFAGALPGKRKAPVTGLEAYRIAMEAIRTAAPDLHLVGCGAPILPSVGWVDSMRIGPDIAYIVNPEPRYPFLSAEARHVAMRAVTDAWWSLDPDVVLLRGEKINDAEAWTHVVASALGGGNYLLGDGRQASGIRRAMALAPDIVSMARDGRAARAEDLAGATDPILFLSPLLMGAQDTAVPHLWKKRVADGSRTYLGVFAWADDPYRTDIDLPAGAEEILAPDAEGAPSKRIPSGGRRTVEVPAHGVRLFVW